MSGRTLFTLEIGGRRWVADAARAHDLSIPLDFAGPQPVFYGAAPASANAYSVESFIGNVRRGGSCNCSRHTLTPHCNGTHTECLGHVTADRIAIRDIAIEHLTPALLVTLAPELAETSQESTTPKPQRGDLLITRKSLEASTRSHDVSGCRALIIRTLPNEPDKQYRNYDAGLPPYFTAEAMQWIVDTDIHHLIVDLPSIDRAADEGRLTAHRLFWGLPPGGSDSREATRGYGTVTELAYIANDIADGSYLLNLQVAPFVADAAPSRPILYPVLTS